MLFTTHQYLIFFVAVYATWNHWLALLVTGTATLDYFLARGMEAYSARGLRRLFAGTSIAVNLGVLGFFKYTNFFLESLYDVTGSLFHDRYLLDLIVPFGISFYTFEAISYTVDVYQGRIKAERNLPNFLLFILFFPHLVAGPIVRAKDFLRQAHRPKRWSWIRAQHGVQLIVLGLFKKLAVADFMAIYSDRVWA